VNSFEYFTEYLLSFYGWDSAPYPMGLTEEHAQVGARWAMENLELFCGDSLDREKTIQYLIKKFGYSYP
tara:strand:- start:661 stop:867 length:207 start_codon:yes stop_codon:yes gene_type:complete